MSSEVHLVGLDPDWQSHPGLLFLAWLAASLIWSSDAQATAARLEISRAQNNLSVLNWTSRGTLEQASQLSGPWIQVTNASSPYTNPMSGLGRYYRLNQTVDVSSLHKKVLCGYQGWFRCPGDGANQWIHWSRNSSQITPSSLTFEMWPEMSEYTNKYVAPGFTYPGGAQAHLFSSQNAQTVDTHFDWMQEYGIDGVFLQRFVVGVGSHPTNVLNHVRKAANRTGRAFALTYDMSGQLTNNLFSQMTNDWRWLIDQTQLTQDPRYLHHDGKPVLMIWGFSQDRMSTNLALQIIHWFKTNANYGVSLVGGGAWYWRFETAPGWSNVFRQFTAYSPWNVGNVSIDGTNKFASTAYWTDDLAEAQAAGMLYLPVIYPGFSWDNLTVQPPGSSLIPRLGGDFLWRQFHAATQLGLDMAYVAMFDEVDEGTAIFKVSNSPPTQAYFVTYDGFPSDWYLRLTAEGTAMLLGERPITNSIPISP